MTLDCYEFASRTKGRMKRSGRSKVRPDSSSGFRGIVFRQQQIKARNTLEFIIGVRFRHEVNAGAVTADRFDDESFTVIFEANQCMDRLVEFEGT
jgi:hypothetical protein